MKMYDDVYAFSEPKLKTLDLPISALPKRGVVIRLLAFFYSFGKSIFKDLARRKKYKIKSNVKIFFFSASVNQYTSLINISTNTKNSVILSPNGDCASVRMSLTQSYLLSIPYVFIVLYKYIKEADSYKRKSYEYAFDQYLLSFGYRIYLKRLFRKTRPQIVVVSNDHSMLNRVFSKTAKELGILTSYVQHASVTKEFPPLHYDFTFLEGMDAYLKYASNTLDINNMDVYLSGVSRTKPVIVKPQVTRKTILICTNVLDKIKDFSGLIHKIKYDLGDSFKYVLRPHPGDVDRKKLWKKEALDLGVDYEEPLRVNSMESLSGVNFVIAAESNILLEAAILNCVPIMVSFESFTWPDYYGFRKNGVVHYSDNVKDVVKTIIAGADNKYFKASKFYVDTIGTCFFGKESILIADTLEQLINGSNNSSTVWKKNERSIFQLREKLEFESAL